MAASPLSTSLSGAVDFSVEFENIVFAILPAGSALVAVLAIAYFRWESRLVGTHRDVKSRIETVLLVPLVALHLASLVVSCRPPPESLLGGDALSSGTYTVRLIASLLVLLSRLVWKSDSMLATNLYLLLTCIADGVRVHTLWRVARLEPASDLALPFLQVSIIITAASAFLFSEFCSSLRYRCAHKSKQVHIDERNCGTSAMLFLGWLWPLLKQIATYKFHGSSLDLGDEVFWTGVAVQFLGAMAVKLLGAATLLAQPFIINGIVSYLRSRKDQSVGIWLVVAMLFNQFASSLLQSHGDQLFAQLAFRLRSFLIHCVTLRSFGSTPPESSSWEAARSKVLVRVSQDSAIISGAVIMSGMIVPNIVVVAVGSYTLFKYINLAFLGPLLAAATCFAAPMLLGGPLSRSQRKSLEAAESRIQVVKNLISEIRSIRFGNMQATAARQATQTRLREVEAATIFRRVLAVVIVISVSTMSLAHLAAFGGVALLPSLSFDYSVLFASLSMIQIMITPLLSIIQMLPELFSALVSWKRIRDYVATDANKDKSGDPSCESKQEANGPLLYWNDASAEWAPDSPIFKNVSISMSMDDLLVVSGAPGCGKSSLLKSLLGEMHRTGTSRITAKHVTYCDQTAWFVPDMTIREAILFGKPFNAELYREVVAACCLDHDLAILADGDATKLANNGSPLSGGQRKRLSLDRTLYNETGDLVLLDDIFSGLDPTTRTRLAVNVLGLAGFLRKRRSAAILCCTQAPAILSSFTNTSFYRLNAGSLTNVEKLPVIVAAVDETAKEFEATKQFSESISSSAAEPAVDTKPALHSDEVTTLVEGTSGKIGKKISKGHRLYLKSLGSVPILLLAVLFLFASVGIDKGGSFWLSHWAGQYTNSRERTKTGYYIGVYAAFAAAGLVMLFALIWMVFIKLIPTSGISLHKDMLSTLIRTPATAAELNQAETVNKFINDIEAIDQALPQALLNLAAVMQTKRNIASINHH